VDRSTSAVEPTACWSVDICTSSVFATGSLLEELSAINATATISPIINNLFFTRITSFHF